MHVKAKMVLVEPTPGIGGESEFKHDIFDTL
jgi:hypothetical protein